MGVARDSFGTGGTVARSAPLVPAPARPAGARGRAAEGFAAESAALDSHLHALGSQDTGSRRRLDSAATASQAGRRRVDGVIDAAAADVAALAPAADSPAGRRAFVRALTRHLRDAKHALADGQTDAAARAADADASAAGYRVLGQVPQPAAMTVLPAAMPVRQRPAPPMIPWAATAPPGRGRPSAEDVSAAAIGVGDVRFDRTGVPGGRAAFTGYIARALDAMGVTDARARANWARGLAVAIARESGFNAEAVNGSDANAHGPRLADGAPAGSARGALQTIPATFAANHQPGTSVSIYDPVANICAAMNYLMRRYHVTRDAANLTGVHQFNPHAAAQGY